MSSPGRSDDELAAHLEEWGLLFEQAGGPRMAGRVLGLLMVAQPAFLTAGEIESALGASKGAVNGATRLLLRLGILERRVLPGERSTRLGVRAGAFSDMLRAKFGSLSAWRKLAARGLELVGGRSRQRAARLREMHDFYAFMEAEMGAVLARWERRRRSPRGCAPSGRAAQPRVHRR